MKSNKYILSILLSGIIGMTACTDSFERYNTPDGAFTEDLQDYDFQRQLIPFKTSQTAIIHQTGVDGTDWQYQIMQSLAADMFGGYFHDMKGDFNDKNSTYNLNLGWTSAQWSYNYAQGMPAIASAEKIDTKEEYPTFYAVNKIIKVAMMHRVSDYYGPIIYRNSVKTTLLPNRNKKYITIFLPTCQKL